MDIKTIGQLVEDRRMALGLNQEDLSEMSGITVRTIYNIERGSGNPSFKTLSKLAEVLGLEISMGIRKTGE